MVQFEDITVVWGAQPDQMDIQMARWRQAVYQDLAITENGKFMYFLYDPEADENSGTSGGRKGPASIVIFDTQARKFVRDINLPLNPNTQGVVKFMWLIDDFNTGRPMLVVVTEMKQYSKAQSLNCCRSKKKVKNELGFYQVFLTPDGMNLTQAPVQMFGPCPVGDDYIVCKRDDAPEIVLITGPGMTVWRIDCRNASPHPLDSFAVAGHDMSSFYDAFMWRGQVYFLASRPDEAFDFTNVSILNLQSQGPLFRQALMGDPQRGFPPVRKQCGLDMYQGRIYLCGGEAEMPNGDYHRFTDVWSFDTSSFTWMQYPCATPLPLIEPRLTAASAGCLYVWGDCDLEEGRCVAPPTHVHIIRMTGATLDPPPSYNSATAPSGPQYPMQGGDQPPPYQQPASNPNYPTQQAPPPGYPPVDGNRQSYGAPGQPYPPQGQGYPSQGQGYPSQGQGYPSQGQGYPSQGQGYPSQGQGPPSYPAQQAYPSKGGYNPLSTPDYPQQQGPSYQQGGSNYQLQGDTHPVYMDEKKKKKDKDCCLM